MHKTPLGPVLPLLSALVLAGLFLLAFRFPAASGWGYLEALMAFLFPLLLLEAVFRGRALGWAFISLFAGLGGLLYWVPRLVQTKGGLSWALAVPAAMLLWAWEAVGLLALLWLVRWAYKQGGAAAAGLAAAFGIALWEAYGYHVYPWAWSAALGGVPWLARAAAFLGTYGLSALVWGTAAWMAGQLVTQGPGLRCLRPLGLGFGTLLLLGLGWHALPRGPERRLDVAVVQPNYPPGLRRLGMLEDMWARTDRLFLESPRPRPGIPTLLLWPESAVMGIDLSGRFPFGPAEAERRNLAWLFGTEGPRLNLVRGEAPGRPSFLQAKVDPMPFGERMPGPAPLREWLDAHLGFHSEIPGTLRPDSSFIVPTAGGALRVHPLICSEALMPRRVLAGLDMAGGDLLTNHTNDGWFDDSIATDLHAAQIRLRAVETGLPLVRATLTGKSGLFRADGSWELWGEALMEGAWTFELAWRPVSTPARWPWMLPLLLVLLGGGLAVVLGRTRRVRL